MIEGIDKLNDRLKQKGISHSRIARELNISTAVVNKVLHGKYNGAEERAKSVISYCEYLIADKKDLNSLIYQNLDIFLKLVQFGFRSPKFDYKEGDFLIKLYADLQAYKEHLNQNPNKQK